jgi:hypothetical protein
MMAAVPKWPPPQVPPRLAGASPPVAVPPPASPAVPANIHVPEARIMFCVLATNGDPTANHDATHGGDH